jgi:hypothetical protein
VRPTAQSTATPDPSTGAEAVQVGGYAAVENTGDIGVRLRAGPSIDDLFIQLVAEGTALLVIGGPEEGSGFTWWQVRLAEGTEGWVAADFLAPAAAPPDAQPQATP